MTTGQQGLSSSFANLLNNKDVDWDGNCIFEDGKVTGFKNQVATNHWHMRPIPSGERAMNDAKEAKKILEAVMMPAAREQITLTLKKLSIVCGKANKTPAEISSMLGDYYTDLKNYPIKLIEEACEAYRKLPEDNQFMPTSGKLISLMGGKWAKMQFMKTRIDKILGIYTYQKPKENKMLSLSEVLEQLG